MRTTWEQIMSNPTLTRLAKRINRRFVYMSEEDILFLFNQFEEANRIQTSKKQEQPND